MASAPYQMHVVEYFGMPARSGKLVAMLEMSTSKLDPKHTPGGEPQSAQTRICQQTDSGSTMSVLTESDQENGHVAYQGRAFSWERNSQFEHFAALENLQRSRRSKKVASFVL